MHSYEGPSGRTYHHDAEGSHGDNVYFTELVRTQEATIYIPMRDVLFLAAEHTRAVRLAELESVTDEELLGLAASLTAGNELDLDHL